MDTFTKLIRALRPWFFLYVAMGVLLTYVAYTRLPLFSPAIGFGAAIVAWFGLMFLVIAIQRLRDLWHIARSGSVPDNVEGATITLSGTMQTETSPLLSPISKTPCVMYRYEVQVPDRRGLTVPALGFAMNSPVVDTPEGRFGIYALPELVFPAIRSYDTQSHANLEEYLASHPDVGPLGDAQTSAHTIAYDQRYGQMRPSATLIERFIAPGDPVIVVGRFSSTKRGFIADPNAILESMRIMKGTPSQVSMRMLRRSIASGFASLVILAALGAGLIWFLASAPLDAAQQMHPSRIPSLFESRIEMWLDRDVRPWIDGGKNETTGTIPTGFAEGQAAGRLESGGADAIASVAKMNGIDGATITDGARTLVAFTVDSNKRIAALNVLGRTISPAEFKAHGYFDEVSWGARDPEGWISYFDDRTRMRIGFHATADQNAPAEPVHHHRRKHAQ